MEERKGYTWVQTSSGGFWVKQKQQGKHSHKHEFFCPHCRRITGTIDDKYLEEYGFCSYCFVMNVEGRQVPTIDIEYYKKLRAST